MLRFTDQGFFLRLTKSLDMPFPAECVMKIRIYFVLHQLNREPRSRVFCPAAAVVCFQPRIQISGPTAIEAVVIAAEKIDVVHRRFISRR